MRKTRLSDFTGGDVIRLVIVLFAMKEVYSSINQSRRLTKKLINVRDNLEVKNTSSERQ